MNGWHKCHLCDCEFFDPDLDGYWGWCPGCREAQTQKETQKKAQKGNKIMSNKELLERVHTFLSMLCRDGKCGDHCSACLEASDLADDVWAALHATEGSATQP